MSEALASYEYAEMDFLSGMLEVKDKFLAMGIELFHIHIMITPSPPLGDNSISNDN